MAAVATLLAKSRFLRAKFPLRHLHLLQLPLQQPPKDLEIPNW
jgi:hypothetical protein